MGAYKAMISIRPAPRRWLFCLLAGVALAIAVSPADARKPKPAPAPPPEVVAPPPPRAPSGPVVGVPERLVDQAAAYEGYMRRAVQISPNFANGQGIAESLRAGAAYEPAQFIHGAIAYATMAALRDPTFVSAVRAAGASQRGHQAIIEGIYASPAYAFSFAGSASAAGRAKDALVSEGMRLYVGGKAVKQAAYDIQHQSWSLGDVPDRPGRLAAVKSLSSTTTTISPSDAATLRQLVQGGGGGALPAPPPYSPLIAQAMALAVMVAIGEAEDDTHLDRLSWLMEDRHSNQCVKEAKLNLYQCLAVAKPHYEDVFCLGQHALKDTGACVVKGAGGAVPIEVITSPLNIPPPGRSAAHRPVKRRK